MGDETLIRLETVSRLRRRDRDHNPGCWPSSWLWLAMRLGSAHHWSALLSFSGPVTTCTGNMHVAVMVVCITKAEGHHFKHSVRQRTKGAGSVSIRGITSCFYFYLTQYKLCFVNCSLNKDDDEVSVISDTALTCIWLYHINNDLDLLTLVKCLTSPTQAQLTHRQSQGRKRLRLRHGWRSEAPSWQYTSLFTFSTFVEMKKTTTSTLTKVPRLIAYKAILEFLVDQCKTWDDGPNCRYSSTQPTKQTFISASNYIKTTTCPHPAIMTLTLNIKALRHQWAALCPYSNWASTLGPLCRT